MPRPTCVQCKTNDTLLWRRAENGPICFECYIANTEKYNKINRISNSPTQMPQKPPALRERGRRSIFNNSLLQANTAMDTAVTSDSVFFKGIYMQVGDVVSLEGIDDGTYYAQIRGFLTDQHCEKSAVVTWLLPTKASPAPEKGFDPVTYIIGPEEAFPHKLKYMKFIMHVPPDYYKTSSSPYPLTDYEHNNCTGYIWQSHEAMEKIKVLL